MAEKKESQKSIASKMAALTNIGNAAVQHTKQVKSQAMDRLAALVTSAFGLVAALAWNTAIQNWFENQEYLQSAGPWVYAALVTVIAVVATLWVNRIADKMR